MSFPGDEPDLDAVCEYLGLVDDAESHATYPTEAHRCYRLPNPTRIASAHQERFCLGANHVDCPVFRGEGVAQTTRTATTPPPPPPTREAEPASAVRGPDQPPARRQQRQRRDPGMLGPRPRPGGISMPAATIGLLGLAIAIVGLAFVTQQILSGNGDAAPPADTLSTQQALEATQTAFAAAPEETPDDGTDAVDPGDENGLDPDPDATPGPDENGDVPNGDITYTVQSGDTCFGLATEYGTTVDEIVAANPELDDDCALIAGTDIIIPQ